MDIFPATPTRDGGSRSIDSSLITITLFHTHAETDFRREGGINLCSWSFLEIWPAYATPVPMQHVVPLQVCNTLSAVHPREPAQFLGEFTGPAGRAGTSSSPPLPLGSNSFRGWYEEEVSWVPVNDHRSQEQGKGGRSCCLFLPQESL